MSIPNPEHFLQQAERLIQSTRSGPPRQADLRRAVSAAYYAVFHAVLAGVADQVVGASRRSSGEYGRVYRSVGHKELIDLCELIQKTTFPQKYRPHVPAGGFDQNILDLAVGLADLQEARHSADYDPMISFRSSGVLTTVQTARATLSSFRNATAPSRTAFLSLLVFPPRR